MFVGYPLVDVHVIVQSTLGTKTVDPKRKEV